MVENFDFSNGVFVLDGGLATELESKGACLTNDPLWSARLLHINPDIIKQVHTTYLENQAEIITTASYQASTFGFQKYVGFNLKRSKDLIKLSVELAKSAREEYGKYTSVRGKKICIAGSIGPYGAFLADGSEYSGDYSDKMTHEELINWHRPRIECLLEAGVDLLAFETIPALKEAEALLKLLNDFPNAKAWLSFSCQSDHKNVHGEDIKSVVSSCLKRASQRKLIAMGVNCCPPIHVDSLLNDISTVSSEYPLIVYPNSGEEWDNCIGWTGNKTEDRKYLKSWISKFPNLSIIGGCCRTTPEDTLYTSKFLQSCNM